VTLTLQRFPHGPWAELRIAETRASTEPLRKAYGIGLCSVEELGSSPIVLAVPVIMSQQRKSPATVPTMANRVYGINYVY